jgi:hypothetical protein
MKKITGWPSWNAAIINTCAMIRHSLNVLGSLRSTVAGLDWGKNSTASDVMKIVARRPGHRQPDYSFIMLPEEIAMPPASKQRFQWERAALLPPPPNHAV